MVPILSFLLTFLNASIPFCQSAVQAQPSATHSASIIAQVLQHFRASCVTPVLPKGLRAPGRRGARTRFPKPPVSAAPAVPTLTDPAAVPLICSDPASLNFLRPPSGPGERRPLEINLTETERPTSSHAWSHSHDRCPRDTQTRRCVYTLVSARTHHPQLDLRFYECHWAGT